MDFKQKFYYQEDARFKKTFKRSRNDPGNPGQLIDYDESVFETETSFSQYVVESKASLKTPGYFKMKKGDLPSNEYHFIRYSQGVLGGFLIDKTVVSSTQSLDTTVWAGIGPWSLWDKGSVYDFLAPSLSAFSPLESRANSALLQKVKNQKINIAQAFAESKKTVEMITTNLLRLASLYKALKRGDIWAAGRAIGGRPSRRVRRNFKKQSPQDAAATAWLEMQYGWKPLMMDIRGAISMFGEGDTSAQYIKAAVRISDKVSDSQKYTDWRGFITTCDRTLNLAVKKSVTYRVEMGVSALSARLGLQNPALLAWELVPFSFVADWALPIGDWLGNLDATTGLRLVSGSTTYVRESTNKNRVEANPLYSGDWRANPALKEQQGLITGEDKLIQIDREPMSDFPSPEFPSFKDPLSVGHALNAVALIQVIFGGRSGRR